MKNGMRAITRQIRLKEWTEVFRDRAESGMLVKDYCDAHGITKDETSAHRDTESYGRQQLRFLRRSASVVGLITGRLL